MTIVAGYVPNELGRTVLDAAVEEAVRRGGDLLLVNSATGAYADKGMATEADLEEAASRARARGVLVATRQVPDALAVAETLLDEAERVDAQLVVIGVRSRSRAGKFLLGSTAQTVLLRAHCDVLAVKQR